MSSRKRLRELDASSHVFEAFGTVYRQYATRALHRLRLALEPSGRHQQQQPSSSPRGQQQHSRRNVRMMDRLVIQYSLFFFPIEQQEAMASAATHHRFQFLTLARMILTQCDERAQRATHGFFQPEPSLALFCESLVEESQSGEVEEALTEMGEFVRLRERIAALIVEGGDDGGDEDDDDGMGVGGGGYDEHYDGGSSSNHWRGGGADAEEEAALARELLAFMYTSLQFWTSIHVFLHALARDAVLQQTLQEARRRPPPPLPSTASASPVTRDLPPRLQPRYEEELLKLLLRASEEGVTAGPGGEAGSTGSSSPSDQQQQKYVQPKNEALFDPSSIVVKLEERDEDEEMAMNGQPQEGPEGGQLDKVKQEGDEGDDMVKKLREEQELERTSVSSALLASLLSLSNVPSPDSTLFHRLSVKAVPQLKGIHPGYYRMLYSRLSVIVSRHRLHAYAKQNASPAPPFTSRQEEYRRMEAAGQGGSGGALNPGSLTGGMGGLPVNYVPDQQYYTQLLQTIHRDDAAEGGTLGEDEEVFTEEVLDYYLRRRPLHVIKDAAADAAAAAGNNNNNSGPTRTAPTGLVKPDRVCKVKSGFTWTQYNRTHYDSRTNPPPKTIMWYDFTLFYPALAKTKRNPLHFFRIEDTPSGPQDEYCLLVFSVGPPYADVAYRIVRKQWDPRRGGVRVSFDATGKFRLFFRFASSNYRR